MNLLHHFKIEPEHIIQHITPEYVLLYYSTEIIIIIIIIIINQNLFT